MENFVLYEELFKGEHSVIYKGRRKGTINFLAIHCIDKSQRAFITNHVRLTNEISHKNIVKFYEWYETSNHLWLVVELCTGGSLESLLAQDGHLPESAVRNFGVDLVTGLHYIHSLGLIFADLRPAKILLDGPGVLKYGDFSLTRLEGENLEEMFIHFAESGGESVDQETSPKPDASGSPSYMAPEVIQGGEYSIESDLWSLGCVLYELYTGHPPFLAEGFEQLVDKVLHKEHSTPKVKGSRFSGKASPEFVDLINGFLKKNPNERLGWKGLVNHPFWQGALRGLAQDLEGGPPSVKASLAVSKSLRESVTMTTGRKISSVLGKVVVLEGSTEKPLLLDNVAENVDQSERPVSSLSDQPRPKSAQANSDLKPMFTLSSRPGTVGQQDERVTSPHKLAQSPLSIKETFRKNKTPRAEAVIAEEAQSELQELIYHESDWTVTQIVDNPKVMKPAPLKYDAKTLPVPPYSVDKILSLQSKDQLKHIQLVVNTIESPEKGPPSQKRMHFLNYLAVIASHPVIANLLVKCNGLSVLARQLKEQPHELHRTKVARAMGLAAYCCTEVEETLNLTEPVTVITELIRDGFRNTRQKQGLLPALGELLFLIASQEEVRGHPVEHWGIPSVSFTMVTRCLREGEDPVVNHCAAKIIENIASINGQHIEKFLGNDVALSLWYVFNHSTVDTLRITAISALCRLAKHSVSVFQCVIEKVGLPSVLDTLGASVSRVQQAMVTLFACLISSASHLQRLMQDKDFVQRIMKLLEHPSAVIRAKAFLVILEVIQHNQEMVLGCCQMRLVMYIERDFKKQTSAAGDYQEQLEYLGRCLDLIIQYIVETIPKINSEMVSALEAVSGRKHPSTVQAKQLKAWLPMMPVLLHLVTSQIFRPKVVTKEFFETLATFLNHVKSIDAGETNIEPATGPAGTEEFTNTVLSILEAISQHPGLTTQFSGPVIEKILPALGAFISSQNGNTRAMCLRLFSDLATTFLNEEQFEVSHRASTKLLQHIIRETLLPQYEQILLDQDPLPSYGLKLLLALLEHNVAFIKQFESLGLVQVLFQVLLDHQSNPVSNAMQSMVGILNCLVSHKETDIQDLYDQGLVDHLSNVFIEVTSLHMSSEDKGDPKTLSAMMNSLLETIHYLLKNISEVVRKALHSKKTGGTDNTDAEMAEQLLLNNKPFTELTGLLTQLLCHEESDIQELACKNLSLMVQLYGGEYPESLSPENMECYSEALKMADSKKQKIILRIIKRLVSTGEEHARMLREEGSLLTDTMKKLADAASSHADVALSSLASEILRSAGLD
ncbi:serine/threonine-protein kinase ULK4 [Lingula anatina]|uniref:Serine/threonine-protein kinase ULK4 n=1 Tax=Lingula anatina TaxID=7574 RepID=A0A1S3IFH9_LINAN|nr:serine/threonine-protein kinase ULK4 [Lingula anatina]|eukprot:XP_013396898.1 serine/threonine-protein kinase ULK4 [Lingula anatina]